MTACSVLSPRRCCCAALPCNAQGHGWRVAAWVACMGSSNMEMALQRGLGLAYVLHPAVTFTASVLWLDGGVHGRQVGDWVHGRARPPAMDCQSDPTATGVHHCCCCNVWWATGPLHLQQLGPQTPHWSRGWSGWTRAVRRAPVHQSNRWLLLCVLGLVWARRSTEQLCPQPKCGMQLQHTAAARLLVARSRPAPAVVV